MKNLIKIFALHTLLLLTLSLCFSCKKGWLDAKPRKSLVVPTTLTDIASLSNKLRGALPTPVLGELGADNYVVSDANFQLLSVLSRNAYIWGPDVFVGLTVSGDWFNSYQNVLYSNLVIEGLNKIKIDDSNRMQHNSIMGVALFHRAYSFYNLAQVFSPPYSDGSAENNLGIPLRLNSNVNNKVNRSYLSETYKQILDDLTLANDLLPLTTSNPDEPNKSASLALFARIYLTMGKYDQADVYADLCLKNTASSLVDYNTLNISSATPFANLAAKPEKIFDSTMILDVSLFNYGKIDNLFFTSYQVNDLRKSIYFTGSGNNITFKGSYQGSILNFSGIAIDEIYLIRAECKARAGKVTEAMSDLNALLVKRWKTGTFTPFSASNKEDALRLILDERRKELIFRGLRWSDLRRLNFDPTQQITLKRIINNQTYTLPPNDNRYAFPIPPDEILYAGLEQN